MPGIEFEGIGQPFSEEEETAIRERALDGAVRERMGVGLDELHSRYTTVYRGDPDRIAAAMNRDVGDIVAALTGPPADENGIRTDLREPGKEQL